MSSLLLRLDYIVETRQVTLNEVVETFLAVADIIPVLFVADEVQELQKRSLIVDDDSITLPSSEQNQKVSESEPALRYFTRILKDLLSAPILMILSGTQYHILSQIGTKIGSPIAQKVQSFLIKNFTRQEVDEYVAQIKHHLIETNHFKENNHIISTLLTYYRDFLYDFSGGHPRTVVLITQWFLADLQEFIIQKPDREKFREIVFKQVERDFKQRIFTHEQQDHIRSLQSHKFFPLVKEWLVNRATIGFFLGSEPRTTLPRESRVHVEDLIYKLMTLGVIVKNGLDRYHVTSYFHLLAFLECLTDEYEQFLHQVLANHYFLMMCGGHTGFGYTFEHIFLAAILLKARESRLPNKKVKTDADQNIILDKMQEQMLAILTRITKVEEISKEVNWNTIDFRPNVMYHTPHARAIDMFVLDANNDRLILIQVTTSKTTHKRKIETLFKYIKEVKKRVPNKKELEWYITLFPTFNQDVSLVENGFIVITSSDALKSLLGKELTERLRIIKQQLEHE